MEETTGTDEATLTTEQRKTRNALMLITGIVMLAAFLVIIYATLRIPIPDANRSAFDILLGAIMGSTGTIVTYYFGSSKSSADKNELLKQKTDGTKNPE